MNLDGSPLDARRPVRAAARALLAAALAACGTDGEGSPAPTPPAAGRPSLVVLVVADALRADRLEARRADIDVMPRLRALAESSWWFRRAYAQANWTKPAMASLLTSLDPEVHGVLFGPHVQPLSGRSDLADALPDGLDDLGTTLRRAGYRAAAVQTNPNLGRGSGFERGFTPWELCPPARCQADRVTERALALARRIPSPLFLYVHYMDAHVPYDPPSVHRDRFGPLPGIPEPDRRRLADASASYLNRVLREVGLTAGRRLPPESQAVRAHFAHLYDGAASFLDTEIARLVETLERERPGALVVVTADHGEELWDHGSIGHAKTLHEEVIRVPLLVRAAGLTPRRVNTPVEAIDLLPTLADLLGLEASPSWQGRSLVPGAPPRPTTAFASTRMSFAGSNVDLECAILGDQKLVVDRRAGNARRFDLGADPGERRPLALDGPGSDALHAVLDARHALQRRHPRFGIPPPRYPIPGEDERALRALGYLR